MLYFSLWCAAGSKHLSPSTSGEHQKCRHECRDNKYDVDSADLHAQCCHNQKAFQNRQNLLPVSLCGAKYMNCFSLFMRMWHSYPKVWIALAARKTPDGMPTRTITKKCAICDTFALSSTFWVPNNHFQATSIAAHLIIACHNTVSQEFEYYLKYLISSVHYGAFSVPWPISRLIRRQFIWHPSFCWGNHSSLVYSGQSYFYFHAKQQVVSPHLMRSNYPNPTLSVDWSADSVGRRWCRHYYILASNGHIQ